MFERSFPLNNTDYGAEDAQLFFATRTRGVFASNHLAVTAGSGMTITLGEGIAWLKNGDFGGLVYGNTAPLVLPVGLADATYPRIDRVVIRYDVQTNSVHAYVKAGTPASSPVPPALTRDTLADEISVAQVYVGVAATSISAGNITDERLNMDVCGLMRDGVTGIDTSVIEAQWREKLEELEQWFNVDFGETIPVQVAQNAENIAKKITGFQKTTFEVQKNKSNWNPVQGQNVEVSSKRVEEIVYGESFAVARPNGDHYDEFYAADVRVWIGGNKYVTWMTKTALTFSFYVDVYTPIRD